MRVLALVLLTFFLTACSVSQKAKEIDDAIGQQLKKIEGESNLDDSSNIEQTKSPFVIVASSTPEEEIKHYTLSSEEKEKIDKFIELKGLNRYGEPDNIVYVGGSPLFSESSGLKIDRYDYILYKNPNLINDLKLSP